MLMYLLVSAIVAVPLFHQKVAGDPVVSSLSPLLGGWGVSFRVCVLYLLFRGDEHHSDVP